MTDKRDLLFYWLLALRHAESSWPADDGHAAVNDGGRSIGPLQICKAYYIDAKQHWPDMITWPYRGVRDYRHAEMTARAYIDRYGRESLHRLDWQDLARLHNAGPNRKGDERIIADHWRLVQEGMKIVEEMYGVDFAAGTLPVSQPGKDTAAVARNRGGDDAAGNARAESPRLQHPYAARPDTTSGRGVINTARDGRGESPRKTNRKNTGGWTMNKFLSRKFLVTIGTIVTLLATSYGLPEEAVTDVVQGAIALVGSLYVLGQAWVDSRQ